MRCFNHIDHETVGSCKSCCKRHAPSARTKLANRVEMCAIASVSHIIEAESVQLIQESGSHAS